VSSDGSEPAENDGNFRALLQFRIRAGDRVLEEHARTSKANATYHSPQIQNAIVSSAGYLVKQEVLHHIKKALFWRSLPMKRLIAIVANNLLLSSATFCASPVRGIATRIPLPLSTSMPT